MPALITILSIIIGFVLLLSINVRFYIVYSQQLALDVGWLFLRFKLIPKKDKGKDKEKKEEDKKPKKEEKPKKKKKSSIFRDYYENQGVVGVTELIQNAAASLKKLSVYFLKSIKIKKLHLKVKITGEDSAKTAINYGRFCAAVYPAIGTINSAVKVKNQQITVAPDYFSNNNETYLDATVLISPLILLTAVFIFAFDFIFNVLIKFFRGSQKANKQNSKII